MVEIMTIICRVHNNETQEVLSILYDLHQSTEYRFSLPPGCAGTIQTGRVLSEVFGGDGLDISIDTDKTSQMPIPYGLWDALPKQTITLPTTTTPHVKTPLMRFYQESETRKPIEPFVLNKINRIPIAYDINKSAKNFYIVTVNELEKHISTNRQMYEMVKTPSGHVRMYFDIEWIAPQSDASRFLRIIDHIRKVIPDHKMYISIASRGLADQQYKHSYHINLPSLVFKNQECLLAFASHTFQTIYSTGDNDTLFVNETGVIDPKVYSRWQNFRLPFQAGYEKTQVLVPVDDDSFFLDNYLININSTSPPYTIHSIIPLDRRPTMSQERLRTFAGIAPLPLNTRTSKKTAPQGVSQMTFQFREMDVKCETPPANEVEHILRFISPDCEFNTWAKVGTILKHEGIGFSVFDKWSSVSHKYKGVQDCARVWDNVNQNNKRVGLGSLVYIAKQHSPDTYTLFKPSSDQLIKQFHYAKASVQHTLGGKHLPPLEPIKDSILLIHSGMGSGKTHQLKDFIHKYDTASVLVIAPRISYALSIAGRLGFPCYTESKGDIDLPWIVCSIESLHRLNRRKFDIVILDEIETILHSYTSPTNKQQFMDHHTQFTNYIQKADYVIGGDAFLTQRSIDFFSHIEKPTHILYHATEYTPKTIQRFQDPLDFEKMFTTLIKQGKRLYFVCHSKKLINDRFVPILKENGISHLVYHRDIANTTRETLKNAEEEWQKVQVVITSPTITIGIDQSTPYFDHRLLYTTSSSATARDTAQAMWRVRQTKTTTDYWFHVKKPDYRRLNGQPMIKTDLERYLIHKHWADVPHCVVSSEQVRQLYVHNRTECNVGCGVFADYFQYFLGKLGYTVETVNSTEVKVGLNLGADTILYDDIPTILPVMADLLKTRRDNGGDTDFSEMDELSLRKHQLLQTIGMEVVPNAEKLWKLTECGRNLKPLVFTRWFHNPATKPVQGEQLDIYYKTTFQEFEIFEQVRADLPEVDQAITPVCLVRLTNLIKTNGAKWKSLAGINARGGDGYVIKTINSLLKRWSLLSIKTKQVRINGNRERVGFLTTDHAEVIGHLSTDVVEMVE